MACISSRRVTRSLCSVVSHSLIVSRIDFAIGTPPASTKPTKAHYASNHLRVSSCGFVDELLLPVLVIQWINRGRFAWRTLFQMIFQLQMRHAFDQPFRRGLAHQMMVEEFTHADGVILHIR